MDCVIFDSSSLCSSLRQNESCYIFQGLSQSMSVFMLMSGSRSQRSIFSICYSQNTLNIKNIIKKSQIQKKAKMQTPQKQTLCPHHQSPILLLCLHPTCQERLLCLLCADNHTRHELVSIPCFQRQFIPKLQVNTSNPDKQIIKNKLEQAKQELLDKLSVARKKMNALFGKSQEHVEQYYSKLFYSMTADPSSSVVQRLRLYFSSQTVTSLLEDIWEAQELVLGDRDETQALLYANIELFTQKIELFTNAALDPLKNVLKMAQQMNLSKPKPFKSEFSKSKIQNSFLRLSDGSISVSRHNGNGNFPICLTETPFSPIHTRVAFKIVKAPTGKAIALGACLNQITKKINYMNCNGLNKGIYAIDQNNPFNYSNTNTMASWNHHDKEFNQSNKPSQTDLVGWRVDEGDVVVLTLDYFNSTLTFSKAPPAGENQSEEEDTYYEMPIKIDQGDIYPFVSLGLKDSEVSIIETQPHLLQVLDDEEQ